MFMNDQVRYPAKLGAFAQSSPGENILNRIGARFVYIIILHTKKKAQVLVDGDEITGKATFNDEFIYTSNHIINHMGGRCGGIKSLVIQGDAEFYLEYGTMKEEKKTSM